MTDTADKILKKLNEQQKEEGKLPLLLEFYRKLVRLQSNTQKRLSPPVATLSDEEVKTRLEQGQLLAGTDMLDLDWEQVNQTFSDVRNLFADYPQLFGELSGSLKQPGVDRLLNAATVGAWLNGDELPSFSTKNLDDTLLQTIIQATLQPYLSVYARSYKDYLKKDLREIWRRGCCPVCGGSPDISYLEKEYGARWLVCSRCDTEWLFQRLQCPYCGTLDQGALSYIADDKELYRLYVCDKCKHYLKAIDLRKTDDEVLIPLERLLTAEMDRQARERGYGVSV